METSYRHHNIQSCIASPLSKTTEALRRRPTRPTVFLHHHHTSGAIRMSGVALKSHGGTVQSAGVHSAESDEDNLRRRRRRLHVAAYFGRPGHFGVAARSASQHQLSQALHQAQRAPRVILPALFTTRETRRVGDMQTPPCQNI